MWRVLDTVIDWFRLQNSEYIGVKPGKDGIIESSRFPGLRLWDDPAQERYPMPIDVEGQDECFVGRIREDLSSPTGLCFWVVGDQLRKGAATNAVQIAELVLG